MAEWDIVLYDRTGIPLADVKADATVYWELNGYGTMEFQIARTDDVVRENILRFRNLVLFRHDTAGWWGGMLWVPRDWNSKYVNVQAYSAEFLFKGRRGPANKLWTGPAGSLYKQIILEANHKEDTRIREGEIWMGGTSRQETSRDDILYDAILRIQERSENDWYLTPELDSSGRLYFEAHWLRQAGEKNAFALQEGVNLTLNDQDKLLIEQQGIVNDVAYSGLGADIESRPRAEARDQDSIDKYGLWEGAENSDAEEKATSQSQADAYVRANREFRRTLSPKASDALLPDDTYTFENLRIGNTGTLGVSQPGFYGDVELGIETQMRILGMELSTKTQDMSLTVDEVVDE